MLSRLCEKHTSVVCLVGSGLNSILHWYVHWPISFKSLLGSISDFIILIAFEKCNVSSTNILQSEINPSAKSSIYTRKNNDPKTNPFATPAKMFLHEGACPFKRTRYWKIKFDEIAMDLPQSLIIRTDMLFHSCALSTFRFFITKFISSSIKVISSILLF